MTLALTSVSDMLMAIRGRERWTQAQLATQLGVSWVTICRWERGHHEPQAHFVHRIRELYRNLPVVHRAALEQRVEQLERQMTALMTREYARCEHVWRHDSEACLKCGWPRRSA